MLDPVRRCLVVVAHPDDEAYALGGTIAAMAAAGTEVHVLTVTAGERGATPWTPEPPGPALAARRRAELTRAGAALGVASARTLDFEDGDVSANLVAVSRTLTSLLDELAPDLLLGMGFDGAYGHRDHLATRRALTEAWRASGVPTAYHEVVFPRGVFEPVRRALLKHAPHVISYHGPLGVDPSEVGVRRDIRHVLQAKRRALAAHASQLRGGDPDRFLGRGLITRLGTEEWFVRVEA